MKIKDILTSAVRLKSTIDADQIMDEINSSRKLEFFEFRSAGRGLTHADVKACWIRGRNGDSELDYATEPEDLLSEVPTLKTFLSMMPAKLARVLVANLKAGGKIPPHVDKYEKNTYFENTLRFHIPLITNPDVWFLNADKKYRMKKGEVWAIYNNDVHAVKNGGEDRYHLIFDLFLNSEIAQLIRAGDYDLGLEANKSDFFR